MGYDSKLRNSLVADKISRATPVLQIVSQRPVREVAQNSVLSGFTCFHQSSNFPPVAPGQYDCLVLEPPKDTIVYCFLLLGLSQRRYPASPVSSDHTPLYVSNGPKDPIQTKVSLHLQRPALGDVLIPGPKDGGFLPVEQTTQDPHRIRLCLEITDKELPHAPGLPDLLFNHPPQALNRHVRSHSFSLFVWD